MRASQQNCAPVVAGPERLRRTARAVSRRWVAAAATLVVAALSLWTLAVVRHAVARLAEARTPGGDHEAVRFERRRLEPLRKDGVSLFQSTRSVRAVARFKDSYFAATGGGLVELSPSGQVVRHYGVLDGLGESDLTCLAAYGGRLYVGTRSKGLVAFDGDHFERYWWPGRDAQSVTALLGDEGHLLVGTFAGGLLEFDGEGFREVRAGEDKVRLDAATILARYGPRLYVGTYGGGLWVTEGGRWAHFTSADGIKSDRVVGVVESAGTALVASDFGLAASPAAGLVSGPEADAGRKWQDVATIPSLSGAVGLAGRIVICKDDGEIASLTLPTRRPTPGKPWEIEWAGIASQADARLLVIDSRLWLLGSAGIKRADVTPAAGERGRTSEFSFADFTGPESSQSPTSNEISALTFDGGGNLWAGSFRAGLDVFAPSGAKLAHLQTEELREINAIVPDGRGGVLVATSCGLTRLDSALHAERISTAGDAAANSILHVALLTRAGDSVARSSDAAALAGQQLVVATARGLSLGAPGGMRALTTVQGLPGNSVYSVWSNGARVYAGTLGGLAEISAGRVVKVYKDSNSALTNNWVTAVCGAGGRLFVGTYGGGVFELLPSGDLRGFAPETGKAFVNANAMWGDAERLYVGTLDGALVFDLRSQKWSRVRDELPMPTVLSVTGHDGRVYFGTTGGLARFDTSFFDSAD
jgi:ligand-binding sensor domain-containing protein